MKTRSILAASLAVLSLMGCSASLRSPVSLTPAPTTSATARSSSSAPSAAPTATVTKTVTHTASMTPTNTMTRPLSAPHAYLGAGGPRPATATALPESAIHTPQQSYESASGAVKSPAGVTVCDLSTKPGGWTNCRVAWTNPPGKDQLGTFDTMFFTTDSAVPRPGKNSGTQNWQNYQDVSVYAVPYGTQVYYGDWVIASEENGLTVWNAATGHGAWMAREGYETF